MEGARRAARKASRRFSEGDQRDGFGALVSQVSHTNGIAETQGNDPNDMHRPSALASAGGAGDDLDYMHARHESPVTGRYLSVDPAGESLDPTAPQSWNRYSYVQNSPLNAIDPTGKVLESMPLRLYQLPDRAVADEAAGDLPSWNGATCQYNRFNQMTRILGPNRMTA
jgi:RHS repeat-associated protein